MNSKRKISNTGITWALAFGLAGLIMGSHAFGELESFDGMEGRSYHARLYENGRCEACHGEATPSGYPEDGACMKCHSMEKLVAATARESAEEQWQNPHNNLHYGTEVPCVECHGEHSNKQPLCADCHNFEYPEHQE